MSQDPEEQGENVFYINASLYETLKKKLEMGTAITRKDMQQLTYPHLLEDDTAMIPVDKTMTMYIVYP